MEENGQPFNEYYIKNIFSVVQLTSCRDTFNLEKIKSALYSERHSSCILLYFVWRTNDSVLRLFIFKMLL